MHHRKVAQTSQRDFNNEIRSCRHKKGMLLCSFLVNTRLNTHNIFEIYVFCLCYFLVEALANNHEIFIHCISGITVVVMILETNKRYSNAKFHDFEPPPPSVTQCNAWKIYFW